MHLLLDSIIISVWDSWFIIVVRLLYTWNAMGGLAVVVVVVSRVKQGVTSFCHCLSTLLTYVLVYLDVG